MHNHLSNVERISGGALDLSLWCYFDIYIVCPNFILKIKRKFPFNSFVTMFHIYIHKALFVVLLVSSTLLHCHY